MGPSLRWGDGCFNLFAARSSVTTGPGTAVQAALAFARQRWRIVSV